MVERKGVKLNGRKRATKGVCLRGGTLVPLYSIEYNFFMELFSSIDKDTD